MDFELLADSGGKPVEVSTKELLGSDQLDEAGRAALGPMRESGTLPVLNLY